MTTAHFNVVMDEDDMVFKNGLLLANRLDYKIDKKSIYEGSDLRFFKDLVHDDVIQIVQAGTCYIFKAIWNADYSQILIKDLSSDIPQDA